MRFLLRYKYGILQQKTERLYAKHITNTQQLIDLVAKKTNYKSKDIILRYKAERDLVIRIIPGWELSQYDLRDGQELEVAVIEKQEQEQTNNYANKYLLNLFGSGKQILSNVIEENQIEQEEEEVHLHKVFSVRKYLDQQLQVLLKFVQKGKLSSINKLLQQVPKDLDDQDVVQEIQQAKPKLINQLGEGGWGAIHYAVFCKKFEILKELIKLHVNINKITVDGWSPLQLALNRCYLEQLKQLLMHPSVKINQLTSKGTPLHVAAKSGFYDGIQLLLQMNADTKILDEKGRAAIQYCNDTSCQRLIQSHEDKKSIVKPQQVGVQGMSNLAVLRGTIMKAKAVLLNLRQRYLVLDPYEGTLIRYDDQQSYPKKPIQTVPLSSIKNIRIIPNSQKSWKMKKQYFYLEIQYEKKKVLYATKHSQIMNYWFQGVQNSVEFIKQQEKSSIRAKDFVKQSDKNILILDDVRNQIIPVNTKQDHKYVESQFNKILSRDQGLPSLKVVSKDSNYQPKMPVSNISVSSNQYQQTKTSFDSDHQKVIPKNQNLSQIKHLQYQISNIQDSGKVKFSSFDLIKQLGSGAFGKVFLAKQISTGKLFALKALKKKNLIQNKQKKFAIQQVNILKQINHPFIINLNYAFQTPLYLYLVLDYCPGKDLNFHLMFQQIFSQSDARFYIAQLLLAIQHLHSKNILYRDLKPENILLDSEGHIKLTDFGLSKSNVQDKAKSFVGTHAYLSPDMLSGSGIDKQADIYGIGCILYECLVGQPPFYSEDLSTLYQNIKQSRLKFPSSISQNAKNLISGLLQRDPKKRLGSSSLNDVKDHPFFKGLDWQKLYRRQIKAPERMNEDVEDSQDEEDQLSVLNPKLKFNDADYQEGGKVNRFNNFSFSR